MADVKKTIDIKIKGLKDIEKLEGVTQQLSENFEQVNLEINETISEADKLAVEITNLTNKYKQLNIEFENNSSAAYFAELTDLTQKFGQGVFDAAEKLDALTGGALKNSGLLQAAEKINNALIVAKAVAEARLSILQARNLIIQKQREKQLNILNKRLEETTKAQNKNATAIQKTGEANEKLDKGTKSVSKLAGGFKLLRTAIVSSGVGALVIIGLELFNILDENFKIIQNVTNAFSALGATVTAVIRSVSSFKDVLNIFSTGATAFQNEFARLNELADIETKKITQSILESQLSFQNELLANDTANKAKIIENELVFAKKKEQLARRELQLTLKLTDEQLKIITTGSQEEVEALTKDLQKKKILTDENIGLYDTFIQARTTQIQKERELVVAQVELQNKVLNDDIALQEARIANLNTFNAQQQKAALNFQKQQAEFRAREASGEKVSQNERLAAQQNFQNELTKISQEAAQKRADDLFNLEQSKLAFSSSFINQRISQENEFNKAMADFDRKRASGQQVSENERLKIISDFELKKRNLINAEAQLQDTIEINRNNRSIENNNAIIEIERKKLEGIKRLRAAENDEILKTSEKERKVRTENFLLNLQNINTEIDGIKRLEGTIDDKEFNDKLNAALQKRNNAYLTYNNELTELSNDTNQEIQDNTFRRIELISAREQSEFEKRKFFAESSLAIIEQEIEKEKELATTTLSITNAKESQERLEQLINEQTNKRIKLLNDEAKLQIDNINRQIQALESYTVLTDEQKQQLDALKNEKVVIEGNLKINTAQIKKESEIALKEAGTVTIDAVQRFLENPVQGAFTEFFKNIGVGSDKIANELAGIAANIGTQLFAVFEQLEARRLAGLQKQQEDTKARIADIDNQINETESKIKELENLNVESADNFDQASLSKRNAVAAEQAQLINLEKIKEQEQKNEIKRAKEIEKIQKQQAARQKAQAITESIINTALGVTQVLKSTSTPDLGVIRGILVALTIATGAAQTALIASQPDIAADGGLLEEGGLIKFGSGGLMSGIVTGKSHQHGGVRGTGQFANVEVEGGEAIISKNTTQKNKSLIHQLIKYGDTMPSAQTELNSALINKTGDSSAELLQAFYTYAKQNRVVSVVDIASGLNKMTKVQDSANLF